MVKKWLEPQLQIVATVGEARSEEMLHKTVIVIDVLRATSTILTALANGCLDVVPSETVQQAKSSFRPGDLLGGERFCKKIPGFELGNSPLEYDAETVAGRRLILTTTNGTRAIQKANKAGRILIASMLNARACARMAAAFREDVVILCAGTQDVFSLEDGLCAGLIADEWLSALEQGPQGNVCPGINDFGLAMRQAYLHTRERIVEAFYTCANGKRLTKLGFAADVAYCAQTDALDLVPCFLDGRLTPLSAERAVLCSKPSLLT